MAFSNPDQYDNENSRPKSSKPKEAVSATLRKLKGEIVQRRIAVFDIETSAIVRGGPEPVPYAVGFYDGTDYTDYISELTEARSGIQVAPCMVELIEKILIPKYAGFWIYAHNGGGFDFQYLVRTLMSIPQFDDTYRIEATFAGSAAIKIVVSLRDEDFPEDIKRTSERNQQWIFIDSLKLMPSSLEKLGNAFGLGGKLKPKHPDGTDITFDELATKKHRKIAREYLEKDCRLLFDVMTRMQERINTLGGQLSVTLPSTSMDVWRRKYLGKEEIYTNRHFAACPYYNVDLPKNMTPQQLEGVCKGCMHAFMLEGYFGGRTEIYTMRFEGIDYDEEMFGPRQLGPVEPGHEYLYGYDYNSHYAAMMLEPMPTSIAIEREGLTEEDIYKSHKSGMVGIVDCDVYIPPDCYLPPLPHPHNGKLIFPVGRFRGTWDTAELTLLARVGGKIVKSYRSVWMMTKRIFANYILDTYKYRDASRPGYSTMMSEIAKLLMNSLYGKFAMRPEREQMIVNPEFEEIHGMTPFDIDSDVYIKPVFVSPNYICPQLSIHVTALARARLWEAMILVLERGGRLYYCDTDSIFCSGTELPTSGKLGDLKLERTMDFAMYLLPKLYLLHSHEAQKNKDLETHLKIKAKGMGPGIKADDGKKDPYAGQLTLEDFNNLKKEGFELPRSRLTKMKEGMNPRSNKALFPRVVKADKGVKTQYDKRLIIEKGETRPIELFAPEEKPQHIAEDQLTDVVDVFEDADLE